MGIEEFFKQIDQIDENTERASCNIQEVTNWIFDNVSAKDALSCLGSMRDIGDYVSKKVENFEQFSKEEKINILLRCVTFLTVMLKKHEAVVHLLLSAPNPSLKVN
jgi:hypothetical protein